jgi:F0F1-type ATP synthase beta subunit
LAPWRAGGGVGLVGGGGVGKVAPALSFSENFAFLTCAMNLKATT